MSETKLRTFIWLTAMMLVAASIVVWRLQPPAAPPGKIVLTYVSDNNPARTVQAGLFGKLHSNIVVNIDPSNSGVEKVIVQSLAGVGPDVFDAFDAFQLAAYVKSGVALDVTDELEKNGIDLKTQVFPGALAASVYQGRVYGVPTTLAADGIWYHKDLVQASGITLPTKPCTWAEFIPILQRLTTRGPDGRINRYGLLFEWWNWRHFFDGYGARVFSPDGTRCVVDQPPAIAAVQIMHDLVYKYHVSPTPVEETSMATEGGFGSGYITLFGAKRGAMAVGGRWWLGQLRGSPNLDLGLIESPYGTQRTFHAYGRGLLVNRYSTHLKEALMFQRYLASDAYLNLVNDQADGMGAFKRAEDSSRFLFNPQYPKETFNAEWLKIAKLSVPDDTSPYVDMSTASRLIQNQLDLVQAGQKSPADAMRSAAQNINDAIAKSIQEDPTLADQYRRAVGNLK